MSEKNKCLRVDVAGYPHLRYLFVLLAFALAGGCQSYNWIEGLEDYRAAEQRAQDEHKHLFIFYKWWLDNTSNRMLSGEVLSDPAVVALFQDTINLRVDQDFGPQYTEYVAKFGIGTYAYLEHVKDGAGFGEIMIMIAVMIVVQAEIVWRRAQELSPAVGGRAEAVEVPTR